MEPDRPSAHSHGLFGKRDTAPRHIILQRHRKRGQDDEAIYEIVDDDEELKAVADIFESLLDDIEIE